MTDEIIQDIHSLQTCLYAEQYTATHTVPPHSKVKQLIRTPFTLDEPKFGVLQMCFTNLYDNS